MNKRFVGYFLVIAIITTMILTLIIIDTSLDYFSELPEYKYIDTGEHDIESLCDEVTLEIRNVNYGFYTNAISYADKEEERILTYLVDNTNLSVGNIIRSDDYIDSEELIKSLTTGQIYNIDYIDEQYLISVYNFENILFKTTIDIYHFNLINDFDNVEIVFEKFKFKARIKEINHAVINDKIELSVQFLDYNAINFNLAENLNVYIKFELGVVQDALTVPIGLNLYDGNLVKVITDEGIIETNIMMGIQGFDYIQITNNNLKAGDKLILEPEKWFP